MRTYCLLSQLILHISRDPRISVKPEVFKLVFFTYTPYFHSLDNRQRNIYSLNILLEKAENFNTFFSGWGIQKITHSKNNCGLSIIFWHIQYFLTFILGRLITATFPAFGRHTHEIRAKVARNLYALNTSEWKLVTVKRQSGLLWGKEIAIESTQTMQNTFEYAYFNRRVSKYTSKKCTNCLVVALMNAESVERS